MSEEKALGLVRKLCEAGNALGWIPKSGENTFHHYKYATEADLVSALRGELFKRHVFIFPNVIEEKRNDIEIKSIKNGQQLSRTTALTHLMVEWTFVDGETGEQYTCKVPGCGEDASDKGVYKALTGSEKYMLMKSFLIPTGDDPEADSKADQEHGADAAQAVAQKKLEDYQKRAASSVTDKVVEAYSITGANHKVYWAFVGSAALALLLDNGLKAVANFNPDKKVWYIEDSPLVWDAIASVALKMGVTMRKQSSPQTEGPKVPEGGLGQTSAPPTIRSTIRNAKGPKKFLEVHYGTDQVTKSYRCYVPDLWEDLEKAVGQTADFVIDKQDKYINGILKLGDRTWTEIDGHYVEDKQVGYTATDEDLPPEMFK